MIFGNGRLAVAAVATAALLAMTGGLELAARGYVTRNAATDTTFAAPLLRWFETQAAFRNGSDPIATTAPRIALLAGDRLRHRIELIGEHESCASTLARTRQGWVVVLDFPTFLIKFFPRSSAGSCLAPLRPLFASGEFRVYRA